MLKCLLQAQQYQKSYTNLCRHHLEFDVGTKVLLLTHNLKLHWSRKFRDRFVGPFVITEHIVEATYRLDLSSCAALRRVHNVFHVSL